MPTVTTEQKKSFLNKMYPLADKASKDLNIPQSWILAQWSHETWYGTNTGSKRNNYAGLYAYDGSPYGINGKAYANGDEFLKDYESTLKNPRYSQALKANNITDFARALGVGGYSEDGSKYASSGTWEEVDRLMGGLNTVDGNKNSTGNSVVYSNGVPVGIKIGEVLSVEEMQKKLNGETKDYSTVNTTGGGGITVNAEGQEFLKNQEKEYWYTRILNNVKVGFAILIILALVVFFLYGSFIKDTKADKSISEVVKKII